MNVDIAPNKLRIASIKIRQSAGRQLYDPNQISFNQRPLQVIFFKAGNFVDLKLQLLTFVLGPFKKYLF